VTQVPWEQVGANWTLAVYADSFKQSDPDPNDPYAANTTVFPVAPFKLFLVNPIGGRYLITTLSRPTALVAWSPDGRRALVMQDAGDGFVTNELDLTTGQLIPGHTRSDRPGITTHTVGYTRPKGTAMLVSFDKTTTIERLALDGTLQATYPNAFGSTGHLHSDPIYTSDGSQLVFGSDKGLALLSNGGALLQTFKPPVAGRSCDPVGWWRKDVALVRCLSTTAVAGSTDQDQFWALPIRGGGPVRLLTGDIAQPTVQLGRSDGGTVIYAGDWCSTSQIGLLQPAGGIAPFDLKLPAGVFATELISVHGSTVLLRTTSCGTLTSGASVTSYDTATGRSVILLGPGMNDGTVLDVRSGTSGE